ncbi:hypothetical protein [Segatella albensis]|jgi:hypothetical protein|nr:hypothetical protein [Segatella albensis]
MKYFTPEEMKPSEKTLELIRRIARTCNLMKKSGKDGVLCLN